MRFAPILPPDRVAAVMAHGRWRDPLPADRFDAQANRVVWPARAFFTGRGVLLRVPLKRLPSRLRSLIQKYAPALPSTTRRLTA